MCLISRYILSEKTGRISKVLYHAGVGMQRKLQERVVAYIPTFSVFEVGMYTLTITYGFVLQYGQTEVTSYFTLNLFTLCFSCTFKNDKSYLYKVIHIQE